MLEFIASLQITAGRVPCSPWCLAQKEQATDTCDDNNGFIKIAGSETREVSPERVTLFWGGVVAVNGPMCEPRRSLSRFLENCGRRRAWLPVPSGQPYRHPTCHQVIRVSLSSGQGGRVLRPVLHKADEGRPSLLLTALYCCLPWFTSKRMVHRRQWPGGRPGPLLFPISFQWAGIC